MQKQHTMKSRKREKYLKVQKQQSLSTFLSFIQKYLLSLYYMVRHYLMKYSSEKTNNNTTKTTTKNTNMVL